jgi:hypothetical protein
MFERTIEVYNTVLAGRANRTAVAWLPSDGQGSSASGDIVTHPLHIEA